MPDYVQTLSDRIWAILEADSDVTGLFTAGRRDKPPTTEGFLREMIARAPADFPRITLRIVSGRHSAFSGVPAGTPVTLSTERAVNTAVAGPDFEVYRSVRVVISIMHPLTQTPGANPYLENTITALMQAGPRLGNAALIIGWGDDGRGIEHETRPIRKGEMGGKSAGNGEVTNINFSVRTIQAGKLTLA